MIRRTLRSLIKIGFAFLLGAFVPVNAQTPERISFASASGLRVNFSAIVYRPQTPSIGTAIYIHGGGCNNTESETDVRGNWTVEMLNGAGWTVVAPMYFENLPWTLAWLFDNKVMKAFCERNVGVLMKDLPLIVSQYRKSTSEKNIFFVGHSFGGYIVNLLATQSPRIEGVRGFISLHGIWDTLEMYPNQGIDKVVPASIRPIDRSPESLAKILVIHSEDDGAVPASQMTTFRKWAGEVGYELKVYPSGGHTPGLIPEGKLPPYPIEDFERTVLDFMNRYRQ